MGSYGFSDGESSQAVGTLTFLGIVCCAVLQTPTSPLAGVVGTDEK